jgi:hypothetical protein
LIGAEPYLSLIEDPRSSPSEALVGLQLTALLGQGFDAVPLEAFEKALDGREL